MKKGFTKTAALMLVAALVVTSITVTRKPVTTYADNPVVQTYFTADPAPLVVGDTMYLITSHDEDVLEKNKPTDDYKFFTMKNWKCYSTTDMVNWTDHGTIFGQSSFEWGHTWCFRAWAAQCVERDGKFYLYVPILRKNTTEEGESPGYGIGVAVADNPYGPYEDAIGAPLIEGDWNDIDPTVFVDDDGQAYLFYGQTLKYALLNDDMISLKTQPVQFNVPNYVEGPWFTKHNGTYYFMWAGRGGNTSAHKGGETLHYAYCDEPLGNYTYGGLLQETTRGASFTNHPGVADFKGESYLFYHTDELPSGVGEDSGPHRSVCVDKFTYNDESSQKNWKKSYNIPEDASAEQAFFSFKDKYKITEENVKNVRKIIAVRYEITRNGYSSTRSVKIASDISRNSAVKIREQNSKLAGISIITEPIVKYTSKNLASHILGYVGAISEPEYATRKDTYRNDDVIGKVGIQYIFEKYLKGQDGVRQIDMTVDGTITSEYISKEAVAGDDIILTIDAKLQDVAEKALEKNIKDIAKGKYGKKRDSKAGAVVVLNVKTGEVLALASYPDYEPGLFTQGISQKTYDSYREGSNLYNRAISGSYAPRFNI